MTDETITALVNYRMEKSRESIKAAKLMVNEKMLTFAMNRIYYAMFYAVQAALGKKAVFFSKHSQVKGEDVYAAMGRSQAGRYLIAFFIRKAHNNILVISAKDMTTKERKYYEKK